MTVTTTAAKSGPYTGNASTVAFPFTFEIESASEVQVLVDGAEVASSAYSVTLSNPGGTVTFTTAPASGTEILILSDPTFLQDISFQNNGAFLPEVHDEANDRSAIRDIYLLKQFDRVPRVPIGETLTELPAAASRASKILSFGSTGAISLIDTTSITELATPGGFLRPEDYGAEDGVDATEAFQDCVDAAGTSGAVVLLTGTYLIGGSVVVPEGVRIMGPRGATIKRINQVRTTTTASISSGGTTKVVSVASTTGFAVGQSVMFAWTSGSRLGFPSNAYSHTDIVITAIGSGTISVTSPATFTAIPSGAHIQTASHMLVLDGGNLIEGITIDGNAANQTEGYWIALEDLTIQGDRVTVRDVYFKDAYSDAALVGGPEGGEIESITFDACIFENIGSNGIHYGNCRKLLVANSIFAGINKLNSGLNVAHQDGAIIFSNDCYELMVSNCYIEDSLDGVGAFGTLDPLVQGGVTSINDKVVISGCYIRNCFEGVGITLASKQFVITGCRFEADYTPSGAQPFNDTLATHRAIWIGGDEHGEYPRFIQISNCQFQNGKIGIQHAQFVDISDCEFDNRLITNVSHLAAAVEIVNARDIKIQGGRIMGGVYGVSMQSGYPADQVSAYGYEIGRMRGIRICGVEFANQTTRAVIGTILDDDGELKATIKDCLIYDALPVATAANEAAMLALDFILPGDMVYRSDNDTNYVLEAEGDAATLADWTAQIWVGIPLLGDMKAIRNQINHETGTAITGTTRRTQNTQGNIINDTFAQDYTFTAYTSTFHEFVVSANGAVTEPSTDVYSGTVSGGTADSWRNVAHTTTYTDNESNVSYIRIVPKESSGTYRGQAGFTDSTTPSTADPLTGLDYGWLFFEGNAFAAEGGNARTVAAAYSVDDVFHVVRTADNQIEFWKGGDGSAYDASGATKVFTSTIDPENDALYGKIAIRNGTGAIEVKMYG